MNNSSSIFLSFDTGIKNSLKNDPTVCTVWEEKNNKLYLLDLYRKWLEYPELKKESIRLISIWNPRSVLIEDKASGQSLIQDLRHESKYPIIAIKVNKDKITRLVSVSSMFESGMVYLPHESPWLADYENELYSFPFCEHDDQVDSTSQFLEWYKNKNNFLGQNIRIRRLCPSTD